MMDMLLTRRQVLSTFVISAGSLATSTLTGCESHTKHRKHTNYFPQSVMSGDPTSESIVFWTRVESPEEIRRVKLHIWDDSEQSKRETEVVATNNELDGIIKLKLTHLNPDTQYFYQFEYLSETQITIELSKIGKTQTAPALNSDKRIQFAFASCQDYNGRHFNPYLSLLDKAKDVDFLVHLGDYVYETTSDPSFQDTESKDRNIQFDDRSGALTLFKKNKTNPLQKFQAASSLDNYRQLYREYRKDPLLQAVHEAIPLIAIWDDHEFSDDSYGATGTYYDGLTSEVNHQRKRHSEQAYYEYMPIDIPPYIDYSQTYSDSKPQSLEAVATKPLTAEHLYPNTKVYRQFDFGKNLSLFLADTRTFKKDHLIQEEALISQAAVSKHQINHIEDTVLQLTATGQIDKLAAFLPETLSSSLSSLSLAYSRSPDLARSLLHEQILNAITANEAFVPLRNLTHNILLMIPLIKLLVSSEGSPNFQALGKKVNEFKKTIDHLEFEPSPNPVSNKVTPLKDEEINAIKNVLKAVIDPILTDLSRLHSQDNLDKNSLLSHLTMSAPKIFLDQLKADPFFGSKLEKFYILSSIEMTQLELNDNHTKILEDALATIAVEASPTTLDNQSSDFLAARAVVKQQLKHPQSLGILIAILEKLANGIAEKGLTPTPLLELVNHIKQKSFLSLFTKNDKGYQLKNDNFCLPFAALGHLVPFGDLGSRYFVVKDSFDLYASSVALSKIDTNNLEASLNALQDPFSLLSTMLDPDPKECFLHTHKQTESFKQFLTNNPAKWKILGSSISMTPLIADFRDKKQRMPYSSIHQQFGTLDNTLDTLPDTFRKRFYINVDQWQGFPLENSVLQQLLANTQTLVISGDIHSAYASTYQQDNSESSQSNALIEFTTPAISSKEFGSMLDQGFNHILKDTPSLASNTQVLQQNYEQLIMSAPKVALDNDPLKRANILMAQTRVQGITFVSLSSKQVEVEFHMTKSTESELGYLPYQSFYPDNSQRYLGQVIRKKFIVKKDEQGNNQLIEEKTTV